MDFTSNVIAAVASNVALAASNIAVVASNVAATFDPTFHMSVKWVNNGCNAGEGTIVVMDGDQIVLNGEIQQDEIPADEQPATQPATTQQTVKVSAIVDDDDSDDDDSECGEVVDHAAWLEAMDNWLA